MTPPRPAATLVAVAACIGVLSACSQDAQTLDSAAASPLHQRVQSVRLALQSENTRGARTALTEFRADVQRLADAGRINLDDAQVLIAQAEAIDAALPERVADTETVTPRVLTPPQLGDATTTVPPADTSGGLPVATIRPRPTPQAPVTQAPTQQPDPEPSVDPEPEPSVDPDPESPDPGNPDPGDQEEATDGAMDSGASE